jgi:hypothetical protein
MSLNSTYPWQAASATTLSTKKKQKRRAILKNLSRSSSNQRIKPSKDTQKGRKKKSVLGFHIQGITSIIDTSVSQVNYC